MSVIFLQNTSDMLSRLLTVIVEGSVDPGFEAFKGSVNTFSA